MPVEQNKTKKPHKKKQSNAIKNDASNKDEALPQTFSESEVDEYLKNLKKKIKRKKRNEIADPTGSLKKEECHEQIAMINGNSEDVIGRYLKELKNSIQKIKEFPEFSNKNFPVLLADSKNYNNDPDITFFLEELKKQCEEIKEILEKIPDEFLPSLEKRQLYSELFSKLPGHKYRLRSETKDVFLQVASSLFSEKFLSENDKRDILADCQKKLEIIFKKNSWSNFYTLLTEKTSVQDLIDKKNEQIKPVIDYAIEITNELEKWLEKTNHNPSYPANIVKEGKIWLSKYSYFLTSMQNSLEMEYSPEHSEGMDFETRIRNISDFKDKICGIIDCLAEKLENQPKVLFDEFKHYYLEQKNAFIGKLVEKIIDHNDEQLNEIAYKKHIDFRFELENAETPLEKLALIQPLCIERDQALLAQFCSDILDENATLQSIEEKVNFNHNKFENLWKVQWLQKQLAAILNGDEFSNNDLINRWLRKYMASFNDASTEQYNDRNNILATKCIEVFSSLLAFYKAKKQILALCDIAKEKNEPIELPEEIKNIHSHFEKLLSKDSLDSPEIRKQLSILGNFHNELLTQFRKNHQDLIESYREQISNIKRACQNSHNVFASEVMNSVRFQKKQLKGLKKHIANIANNDELIDLKSWQRDFDLKYSKLEHYYNEETEKRVGRHDEFLQRIGSSSAHYQKSLQIIERINQEISRVCGKYIERVNNRANHPAIRGLIIKKNRLQQENCLTNDNHPYRLFGWEEQLDVPSQIDKRLPVLLNLRKQFLELNHRYENLLTNRRDYPAQLEDIARTALEPDNLMQCSTGKRNRLSQFIRRYILYPLKRLRQFISCQAADNAFGFFGTTMGATRTEQTVATLMVDLNAEQIENENSTRTRYR